MSFDMTKEWEALYDATLRGGGVDHFREVVERIRADERSLSASERWIPVSERLPDHNEMVIVQGGIGYWDAVMPGWRTVTGCDYPGRPIQWLVTHWMPIPQLMGM